MRVRGVVAFALLSLIAATASIAQTMPMGIQTAKIDSNTVFVDSDGMTLYVFDGDTTPGKSACNGMCAMNWPPCAAPDNATPVGDWTIVTRDDGSKQWAYKGKPLYTFHRDHAPGDARGDNMGPNGTHVWHLAKPTKS